MQPWSHFLDDGCGWKFWKRLVCLFSVFLSICISLLICTVYIYTFVLLFFMCSTFHCKPVVCMWQIKNPGISDRQLCSSVSIRYMWETNRHPEHSFNTISDLQTRRRDCSTYSIGPFHRQQQTSSCQQPAAGSWASQQQVLSSKPQQRTGKK